MPWIIPLLGVAASVYGAKQASKASKPSAQQRGIEDQVNNNLKMSSPIGMDFLKTGQTNINLFNDFYKKLARGDRSSALSLLAPQLRMADEQNAAAFGSEMSLAPRGGGSAERHLAGREALQGQREDSLLGLRTHAVDTLGATGLDLASAGSSILGQSSSGGLGLLGAIQQRHNSGFDQSRVAGQGLFELLRMLGNQNWGRTKTGVPAQPGTASQFAPTTPNYNYNSYPH